ncbi:MAG TPA: four-carbon acid sugar kinase family protein, partial [Rubrobacteraceae bacterium]|nr:four-carbon acid sugar kinase family protein [Rubrobacteraceae bacterium]
MNSAEPVRESEYLAAQPPERRVPGALEEIRAGIASSGRKLVVLDDDPTGTQTVHGVPVLTTWSVEDFTWALTQPSSTFYVLTNSRSIPEDEAVSMNREIAFNLSAAAETTGTQFVVASRSDSTLRGHYPAETDALEEALGVSFDGAILCPCYLEAGRLTVDDIHWVRQDDRLVPAGATEFARDASFGYSSSDLREWVEEKTGGRVPASEVVSVGLSDIRDGGPQRVAEILRGMSGGRPVVVNAATYEDLEAFVLGLLDAERSGKRFIYRTGPSFVRARGGISEKGPLGVEELYRRRPRRGHGLVLVGSHVAMTTRQLEHALALDGVRGVELPVPKLLDAGEREAVLDQAVEEVNAGLAESEVIVYTSREVVGGGAGLTGFEVGRSVSDALVEVMRRVDRESPLAFVVAKGGITSSDIGTKGLNVRRAEVAGQMLPGIISVWVLPEDSPC